MPHRLRARSEADVLGVEVVHVERAGGASVGAHLHLDAPLVVDRVASAQDHVVAQRFQQGTLRVVRGAIGSDAARQELFFVRRGFRRRGGIITVTGNRAHLVSRAILVVPRLRAHTSVCPIAAFLSFFPGNLPPRIRDASSRARQSLPWFLNDRFADLTTAKSRDFFPRVVARGNARRPHRGRHVVLLPGREAGCGGRVQARGGYVQESGGLLLEEGCRGGSHDAGNDAAEEETTARGRAAGRQRPPGLTRGPHDRPGRPAQRRDASRRCRARGRRSGCPDARRGFAPGGDAIDRRHARERNQPTLAGRAVPGWPDGRPRAARDHDRDARR